ncbi:uncharacterized protein HKW66_Vig0000320 [Vigna angularis]|uniref:Retrotransposon gag domain-containing protein n=1 Tax=Phaseolus angularis TaxID=3914 RepID=A0A8T0LBE3_PHAAN|nr:uncharacterized protein HKW66_Vig0000320 [Vigna angularis]
MFLRGEVSRDQLAFDPEIEKTAQRSRGKNKKKQGKTKQETENMAEEGPNPPRRTLGDYAMQQGPRYFSSIVIPPTTKTLEMKPTFLSLISSHQFTGMDNEDPYIHLSTFYELVGTMGFEEGDLDHVYMRLFPFSLTGRAKEWLKSHPNQSLNKWSDVEDKFLNRFFPPSRYIKAKAEISTFRQGQDEPFCEAWERFNSLLRRCPNHGFEDIAQLNIFRNGLAPDTKMILDAAAGGTMMSVDAEQATRIIKALASTDHQAQHNKQTVQWKGILDLSTTDAILAQNKILTQQMEALTKQMANQQTMRCNFYGGDHPNGHCSYQSSPQEGEVQYVSNQGRSGNFSNNNNFSQEWRNNQSQNFGWKQDAGPSNRQPPYQHQQQNPFVYERTTKLEDTLEKFMQASMTNQKNTEASIRNLETQVGQLAKQLSDQQTSHFSANTQTNPKEHCNSITTMSGKIVGEKEKNKSEHVNKGEENKSQEKEKKQKEKEIVKHLPYPKIPSNRDKERQLARFKQIFNQLEITIPLTETLQQIPAYSKYMKQILSKKKKYLDEETIEVQGNCSAIMQKTLPSKCKDSGSFTIPCTIGNHDIGKTLIDLGANINLMPLSLLKKIGGLEAKPTRMMLQLADRSIKYPYGVVEDVVIKIDKLQFPVDFVVMKMEEDAEIPLILGRPFMKTAKVVIHMEEGILKLKN